MTSEAEGARMANAMSTGGFDGLVGLRFTDVRPDRVQASLEIRPELLQPYGILHGGVLCTIVESVGSVGGAAWFGDRGHVVGIANHTDFFHATRSGTLDVVGTPVHQGRTQQLWLVEIRDRSGREVARGQLRVANVADAGLLGRPR